MKKKPPYPVWVCSACGEKYGRIPNAKDREVCSHIDPCGVCGQTTIVTQPRDFGHLRDAWASHPKEEPTNNHE